MLQVEAKCKFKQPIHKLIIKCHFKGSGSNLSLHPSSFLTATQHSQPLFLTSPSLTLAHWLLSWFSMIFQNLFIKLIRWDQLFLNSSSFSKLVSLYLESKSSVAPLCKLTSKHWHLPSSKDAFSLFKTWMTWLSSAE